jgi:hypothetical protein
VPNKTPHRNDTDADLTMHKHETDDPGRETQVKQDTLLTESTPQERAEQEAHQHDEDDDDCSVEDVTVTSPRLAAPRGINSALTAYQ